MRPLAIPFAGGVFSTVLLFSMCLGPTYSMLHATEPGTDVSLGFSTDPVLKRTAAIATVSGDIVVDVYVDGQGRMVDYKIVCGHITDAALRRSLENRLLFTEFTPATQFGLPAAGKIRLSLRSSSVDVKG